MLEEILDKGDIRNSLFHPFFNFFFVCLFRQWSTLPLRDLTFKKIIFLSLLSFSSSSSSSFFFSSPFSSSSPPPPFFLGQKRRINFSENKKCYAFLSNSKNINSPSWCNCIQNITHSVTSHK